MDTLKIVSLSFVFLEFFIKNNIFPGKMDKRGKLTYLKSIQDTYIPDDWKDSFGDAYKMCVTVANNAKLSDKCEIATVWWKCYYDNNPDYFFV